MDVISVLKADHRNVSELFSRIEEASPRASKTKQKVFLQIKKELTLHAEAEEVLLYPRVKEIEEMRHNGFEADEEHALAKQLLAEIEEMDPASELWSAKCKVLKDLVEHHVKEEEKEIFPVLKKEMSKGELQALGEDILNFKADSENKAKADVKASKNSGLQKDMPLSISRENAGATAL